MDICPGAPLFLVTPLAAMSATWMTMLTTLRNVLLMNIGSFASTNTDADEDTRRRCTTSSHCSSHTITLKAGPDLLSAGPCSEKNVGALHIFFLEKNWRPFCSSLSFTREWPIIWVFRPCKKFAAPFGGPLFVRPLFGRTC